MSTRSTRKKSLPPKLLELEEEATPRSSRKRSAKNKERSSTPGSRLSSPDSRESSPGPATGNGRAAKSVASSAKKSAKTPKGRGPSVGRNATPAGSRASSVTPAVKKKRGRTPGTKKSKLKGHNPDYNAAYHYGSDFEQEDDYDVNDNDKSSDSDESDMEDDSDDMKPESDVEIEPIIDDRDSFTPVPFWCQDYANIPELHLPPSSDDLCIAQEDVLQLVSVYEILRQFRTIVRLSPFRIEDFATALVSLEHSNLISEIHIALLKCLWREDDNLQVQYGPIDQKDSVNVLLYMYDNVTWPENLKFYLSSDPEVYGEPLNILNTTEYPLTTVKNKLTVLHHLTNSVLATAAVREDLATEGLLPAEDHCRVCHRGGDMIICEHCNGPFHGTCLEPPLYEVPEEDWICPVCADHMVDGVFDAVTCNPGDARHSVIGVDRRGAKYWFVARRLWVEDLEGGCSYYSTKEQLVELLEVLDPILYERDLVEAIESIREDLEQHMEITLKLTQEFKPANKNSYIQMDNNALIKVQEERKAFKEKEKEDRKQAQEQVDKLIREEDESRKLQDLEKKRKNRDDRMNERTKKRGDGFQDEFGDDLDKEPILEQVEENDCDNAMDVGEVASEEAVSSNDVREEVITNSEVDNIPSSASNSTRPTRASSPVHIKKPELPPGDYYRLGQEGTYRKYVNQYTTVSHALSRSQAKEDTEKKTRLSHKFSLTDVSTYKWVGSTEGSRQTLLSALRATILKLEESLPHAFMHANWPILRRPWMQAVNSSSSPGIDFSRALTVLVMCIKPSVLLPVWMDSLGHINIKKTQIQAKEEKKKADKREKKEREDEEERLKPWMTWVKYTLPVRSLTVTRQKGEDYRAHGRNGWMWLSSSRGVRSQNSARMGLRAGPHRIAVKYTELKNNTSRVVLMEPNACKFLMKVQKERDDKELTRMVTGEVEEDEEEEEDNGKERTEEEKRKYNLKKLLKSSRIDIQEPSEEDLPSEGVIDVCAAFQNPTRTLYSKNAKKSSLDDLLSRRIQLKNWETKKIELQNKAKDEGNTTKTEEEKEQSTVITSDIVEKVPESENVETWITNSKKKLFDAVKLVRDNDKPHSPLQCYSSACGAGDASQCYSATCTIRQEHELLNTVSDIYIKVVREGKMKEAIKMDLSDTFKFEDLKNASTLMTDLIKILMLKAKELSEQTMQSITPSKADGTPAAFTNGIKTEETDSKDIKPDVKTEGITASGDAANRPDFTRCYSMEGTSGTLYLKRIQSVADSKKTSRVVKYPLASTFSSKSKQMRSILVLVKHELKRLSRNAGMVMVDGFNYNAKPNSQAWPYPCPRPLFRTSWMFRTASMTSLHAVAMQLRILWMSVKWDDMATKPPALYDGKNQVTTDSEIVTTEILKHRNIGRYMETTQYWQRKISIPLDAPRKQVDYSPIRSGLRKRKRAESPVSADPRVEEVWVEELTLELWEIKAYRERVDRERERLTTRRQAGTVIKAPERLDPSEERKSRIFNQNLQDIKQRTEQSLREQREAFKAGRVTTPGENRGVFGNIIKAPGNTGIKLISSKSDTNTAKKIFITKDGKVIGHQIAAPPGKVPIPNLTPTKPGPGGSPAVAPGAAASSAPVQQKVQIVKSADGKIQVRGLLPGQQLVQMPDGRLQIFSNQPVTSGSGAVSPVKTVESPAVPQQQVQQSPLSAASPQQPQLKLFPAQQQQVQQIQPQQLLPKPSPAGVLQSPTKTYTIQRNPNVVPAPAPATPIQPKPQPQPAVQPSPAPAATPTQSPAVATAGKQKVVGIQSLGSNTVNIKDGQLIVQGPDHAAATAIARQLASGQAKLGNVGGKQVLVILGQEEPAPAPAEPPKPPTPPPPAPPPAPVIPEPAAPSMMTVTVTAQLIQTQNGPRIILQGLQGIQLEQAQLAQIQQKVKAQLLEQQALARDEGRVPPTKVSIQLTGNFKQAPAADKPQQPESSPAQQVVRNDVNNFDPPQLAVQPQQQPVQQQQQQPQQNSFLGNEPQVTSPQHRPAPAPVTSPAPAPTPVASKLAAQQTITANLPQSVIKQGHFIVKDGKKVLVLPQNVLQAHQARQKAALLQQQPVSGSPPGPGQLPQHPQSILLNSLTSPLSPQKSLLSPRVDSDPDKFELTDDYIQQTIKSALNSGNLTLEQQEKLINQLDGSDMPDTVQTKAPGRGRRGKKAKASVIDPASGEPMDDEWQPDTWTEKRRLQASTRRKQPDTQEHKLIENDLDLSLDLELASPVKSSPSPVRAVRKVAPVVDDKKRVSVQNKLSSMLFKQKEQLKRDIAKKRALLEKELSVDINREVDSLKQQAQLKLNAQKGISGTKRPFSDLSPTLSSPGAVSAKKQRRSHKSGDESPENHQTPTGIKKDRLYCICKTKYDRTKFYVGCDICSNWFHGSCVGITAKMSKKLSEYICDECKTAKEGEQLYCLCRQPYDESQFYIGCESCEDWFHGRCIGILQAEAEKIEEYVCPNCDPNSKLNYANLKTLNSQDQELIKKTFKSIQGNRNSNPFKEPIDPKVNPRYYEVVKEPMDLKMIERKVNFSEYRTLAEFIGDVTKIFENCRYFNPQGSGVAKCAESLEQFLVKQVAGVRERVSLNQ